MQNKLSFLILFKFLLYYRLIWKTFLMPYSWQIFVGKVNNIRWLMLFNPDWILQTIIMHTSTKKLSAASLQAFLNSVSNVNTNTIRTSFFFFNCHPLSAFDWKVKYITSANKISSPSQRSRLLYLRFSHSMGDSSIVCSFKYSMWWSGAIVHQRNWSFRWRTRNRSRATTMDFEYNSRT